MRVQLPPATYQNKGNKMTKQEFKICEAVALGLSHYYMGPKDKRKVTEEDRRLAEKLIPTLPKGFTMMSESYKFSIWRKK